MQTFRTEAVKAACEACLREINTERGAKLVQAERFAKGDLGLLNLYSRSISDHREQEEQMVKLILSYSDELTKHGEPSTAGQGIALNVTEYRYLKGYFAAWITTPPTV